MLKAVTKHPRVNEHLSHVVGTAAFLGSKSHAKVLRDLNRFAERMSPRHKKKPCTDPRSLMGKPNLGLYPEGKSSGELRTRALEKLDQIAKEQEARDSRWIHIDYNAIALDCYLYAQDDKYSGAR